MRDRSKLPRIPTHYSFVPNSLGLRCLTSAGDGASAMSSEVVAEASRQDDTFRDGHEKINYISCRGSNRGEKECLSYLLVSIAHRGMTPHAPAELTLPRKHTCTIVLSAPISSVPAQRHTMLLSRVWVRPPPNPEQEDIFSSSLASLFTDDTQNSHGTPGQSVVYNSPRHGDINLEIPRHPDVEEGRKLFAHYLWNAAVVAADAIESASTDEQEELDASKVQWNKKYWDVRSKNVLELGAGM